VTASPTARTRRAVLASAAAAAGVFADEAATRSASAAGAYGVVGTSDASTGQGIGVSGGTSSSGGAGVSGVAPAGGAGVVGIAGATTAWPPNTGVYGYAPSGTGVLAKYTTGLGLKVVGKARYGRRLDGIGVRRLVRRAIPAS